MSNHLEIAKELTIVAMQNGYIQKTNNSDKTSENVINFYKKILETVKANQ